MKLCQWNIPKGKKQIKPGKLSTFLINQERYDKKFIKKADQVRENQSKKRKYNPVPPALENEVKNKKGMREKVYNSTKGFVPNSSFIQVYEGKSKENLKKITIPSNLILISEKIANDIHTKEPEAIIPEYIKEITTKLTPEVIKIVENITKNQSKCNEWFEQRKGRITASKYKRVSTRMDSITKKDTIDCSNLVSDVTSYNESIQTWQMKYGIAMEYHAKKMYKLNNSKLHKNLKISESGLLISDTHPWIAASPDGIVTCDCHGQGVLEIKCPASIKNEKPSSDNYVHLKQNEKGECFLSRNSEYYFQIQGQMAISKVEYGDFFVFTPKGNFTERIHFDKHFWKKLLLKLNEFWKQFVAPEIIFKNILKVKELDSNELIKIDAPKQINSTVQKVNEEQITQILSKNNFNIILKNTLSYK